MITRLTFCYLCNLSVANYHQRNSIVRVVSRERDSTEFRTKTKEERSMNEYNIGEVGTIQICGAITIVVNN